MVFLKARVRSLRNCHCREASVSGCAAVSYERKASGTALTVYVRNLK